MRPHVALAAALVLAARPARAIDRFEIQVYESDVNDPGQPSLEVHLNYTVDGTREPEFPGQVPPYHVGRVTFEPALGVTEWLELGAYLQLFWAPGDGEGTRFGGWKARAKLVVPESISGRLMLGLNMELSRVPSAIESEPWGSELRPILGWKGDRWLLSVNPIVGFALTGADRFRPDLEPCAKVTWDTRLGFATGLEYYTSLGLASDLLPREEQEHLLFAVVDLVPAPRRAGGTAGQDSWELNVGVGKALTDAPGPHVLVKAIVGRAF